MAKLTIIGMYNYDNSLFDDLTFPAGIDKDIAVHEILIRSGEFETIYPALDFLKMQIEHWGKKHYRTFEKWIDALNIEFKPLYNYDRYEEYTDTHSGSGKQSEKSNDSENAINNIERSAAENIIEQSSKDNTQTGEHNTNSNSVSSNETKDEKNGNSSTLSSGEGKEEKTGRGLSVSSTDTISTNDVTVDRNVAAYDSATLQPKEQEVTDGDSTSSGNGISNTSNKEETENSTNSLSNTSSAETSDNISNSASNTATSETSSGTSSESGTNTSSRADAQSESNINNLNRQNERSSESSSDDVTKHNAHLYGNIGVTTSTQMLEDYLRVERFNIYEQIADIFVDEFCIMVY